MLRQGYTWGPLTGVQVPRQKTRHEHIDALRKRAETEIARQATRFHHPNAVVTLAAAGIYRRRSISPLAASKQSTHSGVQNSQIEFSLNIF
jgi:hypothetical protein